MDFVSENIFNGISMIDGQFEHNVYTDDLKSFENAALAEKFAPGVEKFFKPAPTWQHILAIWLIVVTGWVMNSLIIKIYWRMRTTNRIYVLAMALLDLIALTFVLLPRFVIFFLGQSLVSDVIEFARYALANLIFTLYMLLPLFLALDRFVAVSYPHKMKDQLQRIRPFKMGLVIYCFVQFGAGLSTELMFGIESIWFVAVQMHNIMALFLEVIGSLILYVMVAVKVMISRKKMVKHRSSNAPNRFSCNKHHLQPLFMQVRI